jgi:hypothetical protein
MWWCGYTISLQNQRCPVRNDATNDHHTKNSKTSFSCPDHRKCLLGFSRGFHVDFLLPLATVNARYYNNLFLNYVHKSIRKKRHGKLSKGIMLLHESGFTRLRSSRNSRRRESRAKATHPWLLASAGVTRSLHTTDSYTPQLTPTYSIHYRRNDK